MLMARSSSLTFLMVALSMSADALRRSSKKADATAQLRLENVACPVMAAMVKRGLLNPDSSGRVNQTQVISGLMGIGNSPEMSAFQALGIVGFKKDDPHQNNRIRQRQPGALGFNLYNWNPNDSCTVRAPKLATNVLCNANIEFQQHAFSTEIRDPKNGGTPKTRFQEYFSRRGVLKEIPGVKGKVMTIAGLAELLKEIHINGDKSGENSLKGSRNEFQGSLIQHFHPSANRKDDYLTLSQWQALGAWGAMFAAFSRPPATSGGESYMRESDLKRMFVESDFPSDWRSGQAGLFREWGFLETFQVVAAMDGTGAGDHWASKVKGFLAEIGDGGPEMAYQMAIMGAVAAGNLDMVHRTYP